MKTQKAERVWVGIKRRRFNSAHSNNITVDPNKSHDLCSNQNAKIRGKKHVFLLSILECCWLKADRSRPRFPPARRAIWSYDYCSEESARVGARLPTHCQGLRAHTSSYTKGGGLHPLHPLIYRIQMPSLWNLGERYIWRLHASSRPWNYAWAGLSEGSGEWRFLTCNKGSENAIYSFRKTHGAVNFPLT